MRPSGSTIFRRSCGPARPDCRAARPAACSHWRTPRRGTSRACWPIPAGRSARRPRSSASTATPSPARCGSTGCDGEGSMSWSATRSRPPLRVEQALGLLPDIEALAPLRALLLTASRPDERARWSSSGPYLTVGKRAVLPAELRQRMSQVLEQVQGHLGALYAACIDALECQHRADGAGAVAALRHAGRLEEQVGRLAQAKIWYEVALMLAESLPDRRPEVELLEDLGGVCHALSRYAEGARYCQRGLALAEAEFDQAGAIAACEGLGLLAAAQGEWAGAQAWYQRGLRLAESGGDAARVGQLTYRLGELMRSRSDLTAATEYLARARERFEAAGDA